MGNPNGAQIARSPSRTPDEVRPAIELPKPTLGFRRRAWREFQRALDPLARPRRLPFRLR